MPMIYNYYFCSSNRLSQPFVSSSGAFLLVIFSLYGYVKLTYMRWGVLLVQERAGSWPWNNLACDPAVDRTFELFLVRKRREKKHIEPNWGATLLVLLPGTSRFVFGRILGIFMPITSKAASDISGKYPSKNKLRITQVLLLANRTYKGWRRYGCNDGCVAAGMWNKSIPFRRTNDSWRETCLEFDAFTTFQKISPTVNLAEKLKSVEKYGNSPSIRLFSGNPHT